MPFTTCTEQVLIGNNNILMPYSRFTKAPILFVKLFLVLLQIIFLIFFSELRLSWSPAIDLLFRYTPRDPSFNMIPICRYIKKIVPLSYRYFVPLFFALFIVFCYFICF